MLLREPTRLRSLRPDVPREVERVVAACLAKDPVARYGDGGALRDDLDRALRGERPRARPSRGTLGRASLLAVGLAGAAAALLVARASGPPAEPGAAAAPPPAWDRASDLARRATAIEAPAFRVR